MASKQLQINAQTIQRLNDIRFSIKTLYIEMSEFKSAIGEYVSSMVERMRTCNRFGLELCLGCSIFMLLLGLYKLIFWPCPNCRKIYRPNIVDDDTSRPVFVFENSMNPF